MKRNGAAEKKQSRGFLSLLIEMLAVALGIGKRKCPTVCPTPLCIYRRGVVPMISLLSGLLQSLINGPQGADVALLFVCDYFHLRLAPAPV